MKTSILTVILVCLATGMHAQRLGPCANAERYRYRESELSIRLNGLTTPIALPDTFVVDGNTSSGTCIFNSSEVGSGVRFNAEFRVTDTIPLQNKVTVSFVADGDRSDPYLLRIEVAAGNLRFDSVRPADISTPCIGRDHYLVGTMQNVTIELVYRPPSPGKNDFRLENASVSFDSLAVENPEPTIEAFEDITAAINDDLAKDVTRLEIDLVLESMIGSQSYITTTLPTTLAQLFWLDAPGLQSSASICSTTLGAPRPFAVVCATANCADYRIRP